MPFVGCCALVYFWTLRFSRIGDFYTLRLGFFGNLDLRIILAQRVPRNILQEKDFCLGIDCGGIDFLFQRKSAECLCGMIFYSTFVG